MGLSDVRPPVRWLFSPLQGVVLPSGGMAAPAPSPSPSPPGGAPAEAEVLPLVVKVTAALGGTAVTMLAFEYLRRVASKALLQYNTCFAV